LEQYCAAKRLQRNPDLIRHAHPDSPATLPVIALPVAMIGSSLGTSLTAAVGTPSLLPACRDAAECTAIALP
jgi:hypothetical protein